MKKIIGLFILLFCLIGCTGEAEKSVNVFSSIKGLEAYSHIGIKSIKEDPVDAILKTMTMEEKVAQLFIVDLDTYLNEGNVTNISDTLSTKLKTYPIGGIILFSNNIKDQAQIIKLNEDIQKECKWPLWISVDEEGGRVSRLAKNSLVEMTMIPSAAVIGNTKEVRYAYSVGEILGKELNALGFNMNFAPVADINTNPNNPVIGDRAFSDEPNIVADMVVQELKGLQDNHVAAVVKHFPGHGDTTYDTHNGKVVVDHDIKRLKETELIPFQRAIEERVLGIMVAHINLPNVTFDERPASLSPIILTGLLREEMSFKGLIITDALNMGAIKEQYTPKEAALEAFEAGADILLMPEDFNLAYEGVLYSLKSGEITEERLDISVKRIIQAKMDLGLFDENTTREPQTIVGSEEHKSISEEIMQRGN